MAVSWSDTNLSKVHNSLKNDVYPFIGQIDASNITPPQILECLHRIEARGSYDTAGRVLQRVRSVFAFGIASGLVTHNPASELKGALTTAKAGNFTSLSKQQLPDFFIAVESLKDEQLRIGLKLIAHLFLRRAELQNGLWDEIDFKTRQWVIPSHRMKQNSELIVPLSNQTIELLQELKSINTGKAMFSLVNSDSLLYALYDIGYKGKCTLHGFRSTASTILNEMGHNFDAVEKQLAHSDSNKIRASYNRAKYLPERIKMMQEYSNEISI